MFSLKLTTKKEFLEFAFVRVEYEHSELTDTWKLLDTKSQATTATAGVFVAASFVFIRNASLPLTIIEECLLLSTMVCLVFCIILAILAMKVRLVEMPPTGAELWKEINQIFAVHTLPDSLDDRYCRLVGDSLTDWISVNAQIRTELAHKAKMLSRSHTFLLGASLLVLLLTLVTLL